MYALLGHHIAALDVADAPHSTRVGVLRQIQDAADGGSHDGPRLFDGAMGVDGVRQNATSPTSRIGRNRADVERLREN